MRCPHFRGSFVHNSIIAGTLVSVFIHKEVSLFPGCPFRGVPLYMHNSLNKKHFVELNRSHFGTFQVKSQDDGLNQVEC